MSATIKLIDFFARMIAKDFCLMPRLSHEHPAQKASNRRTEQSKKKTLQIGTFASSFLNEKAIASIPHADLKDILRKYSVVEVVSIVKNLGAETQDYILGALEQNSITRKSVMYSLAYETNTGLDEMTKNSDIIERFHRDLSALSPCIAPVKFNINRCSRNDLLMLPGIGPAIAQRIIDGRKEKPFDNLGELKERIKGIQQQSLAQFQDLAEF